MLNSPVNTAKEVLGLNVQETNGLIDALREGLNVESFELLRKRLGWTRSEMAEVLHIPERTLVRRFEEGRLKSEESQRLLRLARVVSSGEMLFARSGKLGIWLLEPARALGGNRPVDYFDTDVGAEEVEDLLGRLAHGVIT